MAIEFALVFPVFFSVIYAVIAYALAFFLIQSFNYAAEDALRAAIVENPCDSSCTDVELEQALAPIIDDQINGALTWLAASIVNSATSGENFFSCTGGVCTVRLSASPILTGVTLPIIGEVPRIPDPLVGHASLQM